MQYIKPDIATICFGQAASAAAVLLAAGSAGQAPGAAPRPDPAPPALGAGGGQATDIEIQAEEILRMRDLLNEILAHHTGQTSSGSTRTPTATSS